MTILGKNYRYRNSLFTLRANNILFIFVIYNLSHVEGSFVAYPSFQHAPKLAVLALLLRIFRSYGRAVALVTFPPLQECVEVNVRVHFNSDIKVI